MNNAIVGVGVVLAGMAALWFRYPLTRHLMRNQARQWGLEFEAGEPSTWYVTLAGIVLLAGGVFYLWNH